MKGRHAVDGKILKVLEDMGRASLGEIAQAVGKKKNYVRARLKALEEMGLVERPYHGIYQLKKASAKSS